MAIGYREDLKARNELGRADVFLSAARGKLPNLSAAARESDDHEAVQRYEAEYAEVVADTRQLVADPEHRKAVLAKYPQLLTALGDLQES